MNFVDTITSCQNANGAGTKATIRSVLSEADSIACELIYHAMNPFMVYGVRKFDRPTVYAEADGDLRQFMVLLEKLATRELTGDAARNAVTAALGTYTQTTAALLELVLEKDLRAGFSDDTFNKVLKEIKSPARKVPSFDLMLADKCESPEDFFNEVTFPCQADWKYDGQRTVAFVRAGEPVEYRARSGKLSEHLNGLFDEDLINIRTLVGYDFVMDGEAFASDFTETINAKKTGNDKAKANLRLRAFFMMPISDWARQHTDITMRVNREKLGGVLAHVGATKVILSAGREVKDYADMMAYCNEVIDVHKQEGLILKNWDATYQWDRTMDWCKVKRFYDVDARITGWYPGRAKSRLEGTVGGLNIEGTDEKGRKFRCNVGSGFSDEARAHILANWSLYDGATAVITYQEITQAKGSEYWALRFPVYNHVRDDKIVPPLE